MSLKNILIVLACVGFFIFLIQLMKGKHPKGTPTGAYACNFTNSRGFDTYVNYTPGISAEDECSWHKSFGEDSYNECLNEFKEKENAYKAGKCKPVYKHTRIEGYTSCDVEFTDERYTQISCSGSQSEKLRKKVQKLYSK